MTTTNDLMMKRRPTPAPLEGEELSRFERDEQACKWLLEFWRAVGAEQKASRERLLKRLRKKPRPPGVE